jgi:hypothetical protein
MTHSKFHLCPMLLVALSLSVASAIAPAQSRADMPDADSLLDYSFKGLTLGLELGLSISYLSTGSKWEEDDWKPVVFGMGIGALAGVTTGILLSVIDRTSGGSGGFYLLRAAGYGALLGGVMGAALGVLFWLNDGSSKDVLRSAAWGAIFGSAGGLVYGMIESSNAKPRQEAALHLGNGIELRVAPAPPQHGPGMAAVLYGPLDF